MDDTTFRDLIKLIYTYDNCLFYINSKFTLDTQALSLVNNAQQQFQTLRPILAKHSDASLQKERIKLMIDLDIPFDIISQEISAISTPLSDVLNPENSSPVLIPTPKKEAKQEAKEAKQEAKEVKQEAKEAKQDDEDFYRKISNDYKELHESFLKNIEEIKPLIKDLGDEVKPYINTIMKEKLGCDMESMFRNNAANPWEKILSQFLTPKPENQ